MDPTEARDPSPGRLLVSAGQIAARIGELAAEIDAAYAGIDAPVVLLCVLKGSLIFTAARGKDFPMLEAGILTIGIVYAVATLIADFLYSVLNPRIRLGAEQ